jgi:ABC-2 type transport system permease protein
MNAASQVAFRGELGHLWATTVGTAGAYLKRVSAYTIELVRWPLGPLVMFATWRVTYSISGRTQIDGVNVAGFLVIGMFGIITWTSSIWSSGYAIEFERWEGTSGALFLSPASRAAVVAGYGLGNFLWFLPSFATLVVLGTLSGARLHVSDPLAPLVAALVLMLASLAAGFMLSGLFILSRRGNLIANFMQYPVYLLSGCLVPRTALPAWLHPFSDALSASHAIDALRAGALHRASLTAIGPQLLLSLGISALYVTIGLVGLGKVEDVAKRLGQLDLY